MISEDFTDIDDDYNKDLKSCKWFVVCFVLLLFLIVIICKAI